MRKQRGWVFEEGVDDVSSECDLDGVTQWDLIIENDGTHEPDVLVDKVLALIT